MPTPPHQPWIDIPAGTLTRGTPCEDVAAILARHDDLDVDIAWFRKECPRAEVPMPAYRIARTPVTWADWEFFARDTRLTNLSQTRPPDHPVTGVAWDEAVAYCAWLSDQLGAQVRLPSEDEWERAARGADAREYPWGNTYRPGLANLHDIDSGGTLPVGSFPAGASPFGVLDLAGNCDEWTASVYHPYPGAPAEVPQVDAFAHDRHITRGGAWFHDRDLARCPRRHGLYEESYTGVGFRIAAF